MPLSSSVQLRNLKNDVDKLKSNVGQLLTGINPVETLSEQCDKCKGSKTIVSPKWKAWNENFKRHFCVEGSVEAATKMAGQKPAKPDVLTCPDCDGKGSILTTSGLRVRQFVIEQLDELVATKGTLEKQ